MTKEKHSVDLSKPVLKEPIERDRLIQLLYAAVDKSYPKDHRKQIKHDPDRGRHTARTKAIRKAQVRYRALNASVEKFETFLTDKKISTLTIDERLIRDFQAYLTKTSTIPITPQNRFDIEKPYGHIRQLINDLPSEMRQRELITMVEYNRIHKWDKFSDNTPKILNHFVKNGRKLKAKSTRKDPELSKELLSEPHREQIARITLSFMRVVDATDVLQVTADDVDEFIDHYIERGNPQTAIDMLNYIHPLFTNLLAKNLIESDPLIDLPKREIRENLDYVAQAGMDILADLSTVNMSDIMDVRGRLMSFTMNYDFALRNRESSLVKITDLTLKEITTMLLPQGIQKVKKEDSLLFSYFPEVSRVLLDQYVKLRADKNPTTDILLVSDKGTPLRPDSCREIVKAHCLKLGIKTEAGKTPTPHRLRHSFGTLNIYPIGRRLQIQQLCRQYRHRDIATTYRLYIAKNPILQRQEYEATMRDNGNGAALYANGAHPVPVVSQAPSIQSMQPSQGSLISEKEAIRQTHDLGINDRALRRYAIDAGKVRKTGRCYEYSSTFISDLTTNYFTRKEAIDLLGMARATFFDWTKLDGIAFIQIGQVGLFRKDIILQKKRSA